MKAKIVRIVSKDYRIRMADGTCEDAVLTGKIRRCDAPVIGDMVEAEQSNGRWIIQRLYERKNQLVRPAVANVDQVMIVMSLRDPDFSDALIDRLCFLIRNAGIEPILCVTKSDLESTPEIEERIREYEAGPMTVIHTGIDYAGPELPALLKDRITVLTGQSGAGKSSLINRIDPSFHLQTQEISKALGRGKHTTRHNELHEVAGGLVADTPGFSSLDFSHMSASDLEQSVIEFRPYLNKCRFNDCVHQNEPDCAVKQAVESSLIPRRRYENYCSVLKLIQSRKEKY